MKIVFLISRKEKPSSRLRVLQYIPYLKEFDIDIVEARKSIKRRFSFLFKAFGADIVFVQKKLLTRFEVFILNFAKCGKIFDFDDAIIYQDRNGNVKLDFNRKKRLENIAKKFDLIIAGNEYLKKLVEPFSKRVVVIPTPYKKPKKINYEKRKEHSVVWIGSKSTLVYLNELQNVFSKLQDKYEDFMLIVISDSFPDFQNIRMKRIFWKNDKEDEYLQEGYVGIMPLKDDEWCKGKCGFKLIQYMSNGIPSVASPVGANKSMIKEGLNGFFAVNENEWFEKISLLFDNKKMYKNMAQESVKVYEEKYSLYTNAEKLKNCIMELLD